MEGGLWLLTCLVLCCRRLSAYNLDTENVLRKDGEPGSLFGFSLAMHRQLSPEDKTMLLVGAPQAAALSKQISKVTGGLYNCDMASSSKSCTRIIFDNDENLKTESKENQWMGVTVSSQGPGGKIVTCAHRYQRRTNVGTKLESRDIIGRCYVLSQDLTIKTSSQEDGGDWHFCDGRLRGHEMFGSCQQGLSAVFDNDYHYFIFGAPGAYNWKGIVRLEQNNYTLVRMGIFDDGPYEVGDEKEKDLTRVPAPPNSYLGFSLASGKRLTTKGSLTVVAGAPRANHSGAVVLLKKGPGISNILLEEYTLEGEGLASSFGYDLAVLDLNRDGWEDIVVGAPQFFVKDGEIGGAIYVYINKNGKWDQVTPMRINGPKDSMFGLAVENLGDINQDGYHDFAVGAPYKDNGQVYIYSGSATGVLSVDNPQVISGKPFGVKLFGYSLAGNMDLDKNSYPDLAVGSLSDAVFVFRARPVVSIKKEVTFSPDQINLADKNCGKAFCMDVIACFTYTANQKSYTPKLTVSYTLEADADLKKKGLKPRATFTHSSEFESSSQSTGTISMNRQGQKECITQKLAIQENIRDKLQGIPVDVSVRIQQDAKRRRRQSSSTTLTPVLDEIKPTRAIVRDMNRSRLMDFNFTIISLFFFLKVEFLKEGCGQDKECESNLKMNYLFGYRSTTEDDFTELEQEDKLPVISLSNQKDVALEVTVTNQKGDDAHEASLTAIFPSSLTYSTYRVASKESPVTCVSNKEGSRADCELGNPFMGNAETKFYIFFSIAGISFNVSEVEIKLMLNTTSKQSKPIVKAMAKVAVMLQLSLLGQASPSQVHYAGEVQGEAAMISESDIGSAITHQFQIINLGKRLTDFATATLEVDWPKETEQGKWLLYLMKISSTGVNQMKCTPSEEINPLKKKSETTSMGRAAAKTKSATEGILSRLRDTKKITTLSCNKGAKCVKIKCPLGGLDGNAIINFSSRLWNATFLEDYSDFRFVEVILTAHLRVDSTSKNTVLQDAEKQVALTVFPERPVASSTFGGVPWWIIVLSVLLGLLLLALLIFLLWKSGLFGKKNTKDPSEKEKLTANA
ncbi:Integrin alpha-6 [Oryzias melastigma]|uniref:Integrin alpha-6 n=1 Tax=Oryzias melastigma TaxID=30732 RepID=A0A834CEB2_ORYME|nr:Integrin alpha-6 [Oryzias melastigma]